jgi:beta-lactamase class A
MLHNFSPTIARYWLSYALVFVAGLALGIGPLYMFAYKSSIFRPSYQREIRESGYQFISPLLECETGQEVGSGVLQPTIEEIRNKINLYKERGVVTYVSVYFRDLNNGPWFGINEASTFEPASLFKVPLLIAYLKKADQDPTVLYQEIEFQFDQEVVEQNLKPQVSLEPGKYYTVEELLEQLILESDNHVLKLLYDGIDEDYLVEVEKDLGLFNNSPSKNKVTVKNYASLFRVLYNSSYLSRANSEKALEILSRTKFAQGIPSSLPEEMVVAHKFGERSIYNNGSLVEKQLHDCGIVYYPNHPYLVCIMTRGSDNQKLTGVIRDIAGTIYAAVDKQAQAN